jgi:hypothetical protein
MVQVIITDLISSAGELLVNLGTIFNDVVGLLYDVADDSLTMLGTIVVATAGFSLAWAGIRFIFGFVNRLLSKTRGGAR